MVQTRTIGKGSLRLEGGNLEAEVIDYLLPPARTDPVNLGDARCQPVIEILILQTHPYFVHNPKIVRGA